MPPSHTSDTAISSVTCRRIFRRNHLFAATERRTGRLVEPRCGYGVLRDLRYLISANKIYVAFACATLRACTTQLSMLRAKATGKLHYTPYLISLLFSARERIISGLSTKRHSRTQCVVTTAKCNPENEIRISRVNCEHLRHQYVATKSNSVKLTY